jgi:hypothetical protein
MVREPDVTMQPTPQDNQLMSKHRILSFKPQLRLEWRGQDGHHETEQPDRSASLGDSITASTQIGFSVHTQPFSLPLPNFLLLMRHRFTGPVQHVFQLTPMRPTSPSCQITLQCQ